MKNKKLLCPVKRLDNRSDIILKIDLQNNNINVKANVNINNVIKSCIDFINKI